MELQLHPIQVDILISLLLKPKARFSQLNTAKMPTDHFTFHLKQLIKVGLVEKTGGGFYQLTTNGKEFANRFDTIKGTLEKQAKITAVVCGVKKEKGKTEYLVQQRLKQPYFGFYGFVTGKVRWGESLEEVAKREFKEETNLEGKLKLIGVEHKMDYSQKGDFLEDKYFFVFRADNPKGELMERYEEGKNIWLSKKEILKLPDLFDDMEELLKMVGQDEFVFKENKYKVKGY